MNLIQRATNITLQPAAEWQQIEPETTSTVDLYKGYIMPLSAIPVVASFIGMSVLGMSVPFMGRIHTPLVAGLVTMALQFGIGLLSVYLLSLIIDALAPNFGAQKNPMQALKVAAYSFTPAWLAGVLHIIPMLGVLGVLAGLYGIYVLYLGLPVLMKAPQDKAAGYTAVTVVCAIVLSIVTGAVIASVVGLGMFGASYSANSYATGDRAAALTELNRVGEQMAAAGKKMEQAQKSGDSQAQMSAATEALGTVLGAGTQAEVVDMARLKALLPESLAGMPRTRFEGEKSAMGAFKISKAEAGYGDGAGRSVSLTLTDTGGAKMFGAMYAWGMVEQDKESDDGYEKMGKVDGRPTHEQFHKSSQSGEYNVLVGNRFLIEVRGQQTDMATMKAAAEAIGFARLEAMKDEGMKK